MTAPRPAAAVTAMAAAIAVFVARPLMPGGAVGLVVVLAALLVLGAAWPLDATPRAPAGVAGVALGIGLAAFGLGRLLGGRHQPFPARAGYVAAVSFAALAEEIFFRRFVYAILHRRGGAAWAVGGSTILFAVAHVTVYGWWVLPLDLAAGLILSWQRWTSGTWTVPAATHVAANLLVVL